MNDKLQKQDRPLGLYIHVPFCRSLCPYCSFYSVVSSEKSMELWLDGIFRELELLRSLMTGNVLTSIYIGGGTPSALPLSIWKGLLSKLEEQVFSCHLEYTVEVNPESLTIELLQLLLQHGVNRISMGIQSLDLKVLRRAGRLHDTQRALAAIAMVQSMRLRCSCDLMFGLPDQSFRSWANSLKLLVEVGVTHLSIYQLTIDAGCAWSSRPPENRLDGYGFYRWAQWYLPLQGLRQYEIASFASIGEESRHNRAYWSRQNVLGLGPSAWGFWNGMRYANWTHMEHWLSSLKKGQRPIASWEKLKGAEAASERAILALRTSEGIDLEVFQQEYGFAMACDLRQRLEAMPSHLLVQQGERIALSPQGMRVGNSIWSELLSLGTS